MKSVREEIHESVRWICLIACRRMKLGCRELKDACKKHIFLDLDTNCIIMTTSCQVPPVGPKASSESDYSKNNPNLCAIHLMSCASYIERLVEGRAVRMAFPSPS